MSISNLNINEWITLLYTKIKNRSVIFFTEYRTMEVLDVILQYIESHPFLCIILIAIAFSCSVPVILFILFTIVSLIITFMGFVIIEGTILGLGFAVMVGFLLCLILVLSTMAAALSTAYFTFEQICRFLVKSNTSEHINRR